MNGYVNGCTLCPLCVVDYCVLLYLYGVFYVCL